jgi:hypothetical protein
LRQTARHGSCAETETGVEESESPTWLVSVAGSAILIGPWLLRMGFCVIAGIVGLLLVPVVIVVLLRLVS